MKALPSESLVYIDEMGVDKYLYRAYARAPRGQKVAVKISGRKFKRTNIMVCFLPPYSPDLNPIEKR